MERVLFVTSEAHPLIKTGGLADVAGALPGALQHLGHDVVLVMPAYRDALARLPGDLKIASRALLRDGVRIIEGNLEGTALKVWLVDAPHCFDRPGNPYVGPEGKDWPDNAQRYAAFARAVVEIAQDRAGLGWRPTVVHCNDWQSGLVPALLSLEAGRPATLFTIHNLSYPGLFPAETFWDLDLPPQLWSMDGLEYHGRCSYIKGGLVYADIVTTVSPTYAREILTPEYGYGLEGLLRARGGRLIGILNGVDYEVWDPAHDPHISQHYTEDTLESKAANKAALQRDMGLAENPRSPLIGMVGRLVEQKGVDLVLDALPEIMRRGVQMAVLGSGDRDLERRFRDAADAYPRQIGVRIGFGEPLAHRIEAGADMFLMPSRFEPCGLNQIYSLRYGTAPIVRRTGGLADTVTDHITGFCFDEATPEALLDAVDHALALYQDPVAWRELLRSGMRQDYSWKTSAQAYTDAYRLAREFAAANDVPLPHLSALGL